MEIEAFLIEIKGFPPDRKRLLPVRVVKNYKELWLVVDQQKAWEKDVQTKEETKLEHHNNELIRININYNDRDRHRRRYCTE